VSVSR